MTVGYVLYIDEAGDDGLKKILPVDHNGSSEWFIISGLLTRLEHDRLLLESVKRSVSRFKNSQRKDIHYRDLIPPKKKVICEEIANGKLRSFVVLSHKANMKNYENIRVKNALGDESKQSWFYWWLVRILLERVTKECALKNKTDNVEKKLRIVFSRRGGMNYRDFRHYLRKIHDQSLNKELHLNADDLDWSIIDHEEIYAEHHKTLAGLQLADVVASAFYEAVTETTKRSCNPEFAMMLKRTVAFKVEDKNRIRWGYGIKLFPKLKDAKITAKQREIFKYYQKK